jgi:hypothetical protein
MLISTLLPMPPEQMLRSFSESLNDKSIINYNRN